VGLRVTIECSRIAMVHGCTGPAFLALCVIRGCVTGSRWRREPGLEGLAWAISEGRGETPHEDSLPVLLTLLAFWQNCSRVASTAARIADASPGYVRPYDDGLTSAPAVLVVVVGPEAAPGGECGCAADFGRSPRPAQDGMLGSRPKSWLGVGTVGGQTTVIPPILESFRAAKSFIVFAIKGTLLELDCHRTVRADRFADFRRWRTLAGTRAVNKTSFRYWGAPFGPPLGQCPQAPFVHFPPSCIFFLPFFSLYGSRHGDRTWPAKSSGGGTALFGMQFWARAANDDLSMADFPTGKPPGG